jgi:uncharacterized membrane protein YsdA (DUF1294 family)
MTPRARRLSPHGVFLAACAVGVVGLSVLAGGRLGVGCLWAYLIAVNVCTFVCYGYDKAAARRGWLRVPEVLLHLLAALGGTLAAWVAQQIFRHKTIKGSFRRVFWLIVAAQAAGVGLWVYYA